MRIIKSQWGEINYDVEFSLGDSRFLIFLGKEKWNIHESTEFDHHSKNTDVSSDG